MRAVLSVALKYLEKRVNTALLYEKPEREAAKDAKWRKEKLLLKRSVSWLS
jgi:hypothetical protein